MTRNKLRAITLVVVVMCSSMTVGVSITGSAVANHSSDEAIIVDADGSGDFTTIQAAVDHANAGDTIEVQSGTYDGAVINERVTVDGEGSVHITEHVNLTAAGASIQDVTFNDTYDSQPLTLFADATKTHNVTLDVGTNHGASITIKGDDAVLSGSTLTRSGDEGFAFVDVYEGPNIVQATGAPGNVTIENNVLQGGDIGVQLEAGETVTIRGNEITPAASDEDAIWVTGPAFTDLDPDTTLNIEDNGQIVGVDNRSNGGGNVHWMTSISAAFESDQSPIADGATVKLAAGTYEETVVIDESITFVGSGPGATTIDANGSNNAVVVDADDVSIRNLSITGAARPVNNAGHAILTSHVQNLSLVDVVAHNNSGKAIQVAESSDVRLERVTIRDNGLEGATLWRIANLTLVDVVAHGNGFNASDGLVGISDNHTADSGVFIEGVNVLVDGLQTFNNQGEGLFVETKETASVYRDQITGLSETPDHEADGIVLQDIEAYENEQGIDLWVNAFNATLSGSSLHENTEDVAVTGTNVTLRNNTFRSDTGLRNIEIAADRDDHRSGDTILAGRVDATRNYWGHPSGPRGQGAAIEGGNVSFFPFYLDSGLTRLATASNDSSVVNDGARVTMSPNTSVEVKLPTGSGASRVSVVESDGPTGGAPNASTNAVYLDISADVNVTGKVDVTVTVAVSSLQDKAIDPQQATLQHFNGTAWVELQTTVTVSGGQARLTAMADGLSPFAITERKETDTDSSGGGFTGAGGSVAQQTSSDPTPTQTRTPTPTAMLTPTGTPSPTETPTSTPPRSTLTAQQTATATAEKPPTETASLTSTPEPTRSPGLDGFGPVVTLLALLVLAGLARLRSRGKGR